MRIIPIPLRPLGPLLALLILLALFESGSERLRETLRTAASWDDVARQKDELLSPPWNLVRAWASQDSDERVFYEWSRLILGEEADLPFLAHQQLGDDAAFLARMRAEAQRHTGVRLPYRDVSIGYPPLAFVLILLPRLFAHGLAGYRLAFGVLTSLLYLLNLWLGLLLVRAWDERPAVHTVLRRVAIATFAVGPILVARFDVLPAVLCTGALLSLTRGRPVWSAALLMLGALTKLYPLLLVPLWAGLLFGWGGAARRMLRAFVATLAISAAGTLVLVAASGHGAGPLLHAALVYGERPFQIESQVGGIVLAVFGKRAVASSFASFNVEFPSSGALLAAWEALLAVSLVVLGVQAARWAKRHRDLVPAERARALGVLTAGTVLWILATSKVLSPQYLIWCLPLSLLLPGAAGSRLAVAMTVTLLLTQLVYPFLYAMLRDGSPPVVALLVARNLLLVGMALFTLKQAFAIRESGATMRQ